MKYFFSFFIALSMVFGLQSCQIDAVTHFNKDYSGTSSSVIDLSQLMAFGGGSDGSELDSLFMMFSGELEDDSLAMFMDSLNTAFSDVGMKNFQFSRDGDYGIKATFDFDDLKVFDGKDMMSKLEESLGENKMLGNEDMFGSMPTTATITRNGKWLEIDLFGMDLEEFEEQVRNETQGELDEEGIESTQEEMQASIEMAMGMMKMMGEMYDLNQTFTFDRKVKEVESPLPYTSDKHSVTMNYSIADVVELIEDKKEAKVRIRLK